MADELWDIEDARGVAEAEWERECGAQSAHQSAHARLSRRQFVNSLFNLADAWVMSPEVHAYSTFLYHLFLHVCIGTPSNGYSYRRNSDIRTRTRIERT